MFNLIILLTGLIILIKPLYISFELLAARSIEVEIITVDDLGHLIEDRNGRPLLVNVWATWCAPCREEFPDLVKISNKYGNKIDVVGISVDFPVEIDSKIIPFLKKHNAVFTNYVIKVTEPEDFINLMNKEWSGAVPATFIYDKTGNQIEYLVGKRKFEEFEKVIENLR